MSAVKLPRMAIAWLVAFLASGLLAGCSLKPARRPTIDELIPAGATKAEIPPAYGQNHTEPRKSFLWTQGIKYDGDIDQLVAELKVKLKPMGYHLENHTHYVDNFGNTGVSNARALRMFRGRGSTVGIFDFTCLPAHDERYADFAIALRNY